MEEPLWILLPGQTKHHPMHLEMTRLTHWWSIWLHTVLQGTDADTIRMSDEWTTLKASVYTQLA